jgi:C4-dicarboxylate-binding protein DctP
LRLTLQLPLESHLGENVTAFQDEVEVASGGDLKIEIYPSAQLYKDSEVPQAVGSGQIELGVASLTRYAGEIPAVDVFYLPFLFSDEAMVREATEPGSPIRDKIDAAILETGSRVLWWQAYGNTILLTKDDLGPLKTPADMAGKKVRVFGKTLGNWVETVGGVPTLISGSEQLIAYQRGTVDVGMTGISVWQELTEEQQTILGDAARKVEMDLRNTMADIEADGFEYAQAQGMEVYQLTEEETATWQAASQPVIEQFAEQAGPLGQELVDLAIELRDKGS